MDITLFNADTDGIAKLVQTVGSWVGLEAKSRRKMADADAYAAIKNAETENAVALIKIKGEDDIANYIIEREKRKLKNVQSVIEEVSDILENDSEISQEPVNQDWVNRFRTIIEEVSDKDIQNLWARILAGEIKKPQSYSFRTLDTLKNFSKEDAQNFLRLSKFIINNSMLCTSDDYGISLMDQVIMDDLGLIKGEKLVQSYNVSENRPFILLLDNKHVLMGYSKRESKIQIEYYQLSQAGREIYNLLSIENRIDFVSNISNNLKKQGLDKVILYTIRIDENSKTAYNENEGIEM